MLGKLPEAREQESDLGDGARRTGQALDESGALEGREWLEQLPRMTTSHRAYPGCV